MLIMKSFIMLLNDIVICLSSLPFIGLPTYIKVPNPRTTENFYFKIYLEKGDKTFFFLGLALRAIILLWNIITIANFVIYLNICGGFNTLKKVVSTIKDDSGVSVDINDFEVIIEALSNENDDENSINDKRFYKLKRIQKHKPSEKIIRYRGRQNLNMNNGQTSSSNNLD